MSTLQDAYYYCYVNRDERRIYIKFLEDKLTNNTLTDKQYKLVLEIQKLMSE